MVYVQTCQVGINSGTGGCNTILVGYFTPIRIPSLIPGGNTATCTMLVFTIFAWPLVGCLVIGMCGAYKQHCLKFVLEC